MSRQVVQVALDGATKVLTYVWRGETPLAIGDRVAVRNPAYYERDTTPLVKGYVTALDSDYQGYLVVIHSRVPDEIR